MGAFMEMLTAKPKGLRVEPKYTPKVGEQCLVSGPNCDNEHGYTWGETTVLWLDETFVLYGAKGFWPVLNKLEHVLFKPTPKPAPTNEDDDYYTPDESGYSRADEEWFFDHDGKG